MLRELRRPVAPTAFRSSRFNLSAEPGICLKHSFRTSFQQSTSNVQYGVPARDAVRSSAAVWGNLYHAKDGRNATSVPEARSANALALVSGSPASSYCYTVAASQPRSLAVLLSSANTKPIVCHRSSQPRALMAYTLSKHCSPLLPPPPAINTCGIVEPKVAARPQADRSSSHAPARFSLLGAYVKPAGSCTGHHRPLSQGNGERCVTTPLHNVHTGPSLQSEDTVKSGLSQATPSDTGAALQFQRHCSAGGSEGDPSRNNDADKKKQKPKNREILKDSKADAVELSSAFDRLKTDLPDVFEDDRHFTIYTEDVLLENCLCRPLTYKTRGISKYKCQAKAVRAKWSWLYRDPEFHLLSCQKLPEESVVLVRWRVAAEPRWLPSRMITPDRKRYQDGMSTFEINGLGLVRRHKVTKMQSDGKKQGHLQSMLLPVVGFLTVGADGLKKEIGHCFVRVFGR